MVSSLERSMQFNQSQYRTVVKLTTTLLCLFLNYLKVGHNSREHKQMPKLEKFLVYKQLQCGSFCNLLYNAYSMVHLHTVTPILAYKSLDYRMTQPITELESESSFMIGRPATNS